MTLRMTSGDARVAGRRRRCHHRPGALLRVAAGNATIDPRFCYERLAAVLLALSHVEHGGDRRPCAGTQSMSRVAGCVRVFVSRCLLGC